MADLKRYQKEPIWEKEIEKLKPNELKFPDLDLLLPHQKEVIFAPQRFKTLVWHRRARKTSTAITETIRQALIRPGVYWHIFPTYGEAKDAVWRDPNMLFRIIPESVIKKTNESELVVTIQTDKGKSIFQLKGADDPDALRGPNPLGIVFDEWEKMKYEAWGITEPILRANGGWAWFIGTPMGRNHLWDFYQKGLRGHHEWKSWLLKASTSGIIDKDQLLESRQSMSEALYNQEWECEFLEGVGQVFRGVREIVTAVPQRPQEGHYYTIGCDLAKVTDYTVITVFDNSNNNQVYQQRIQHLEWPHQKKIIAEVARMYNNALVVLDATGLGDPIADDLLRAGVAVDPIKISAPVKKEMIEKLSIYIEQKHIRILNMEDTLLEFDNFSYALGPTGRVQYGAPSGFHDDIVISIALAVYRLNPVLSYKVEKPRNLIQQHYDQAKKTYDNQDTDGWGEWEQS